MILFLDDCPNRAAITYARWSPERTSDTIWCRTAEEAITVLRDYEIDEAHLDHDLEGPFYLDTRHPNSGSEVVRWISTQDLSKFQKTEFIVHSHNGPAARSMVDDLRKLGLNAKYTPFGWSAPIY